MCIWMFVWLKWDWVFVLYNTKYISASQLHKLHSTCRVGQFQLLCFISRIKFSHSIRQLPCQSASGNDFTVPPEVERHSSLDQCSVTCFCDGVCDLLYGGHPELSSRSGWNAISGEQRGKWRELQPEICVLHSSSTNHHYPQASSIHLTTFQLH